MKPTPMELERIDAKMERDATIEHCAQIVESFHDLFPEKIIREITAAIRALKEKP